MDNAKIFTYIQQSPLNCKIQFEQVEDNYRKINNSTIESRRLIADLLDAYDNGTLEVEMVNHLRDRAEKILKDSSPFV